MSGHTSLVNARSLPVGDQITLSAPVERLVTWTGSPAAAPLSTLTFHTCGEPARVEMNAIHCPSGDQRPPRSPLSWLVSWRGSPPLAATIHRWLTTLFFSWSTVPT